MAMSVPARYSRMPLVKGIRRPLAFTDEPNLFSDPHVAKDDGFNEKFREGFALLSKYNLSFDTWMYLGRCLDPCIFAFS